MGVLSLPIALFGFAAARTLPTSVSAFAVSGHQHYVSNPPVSTKTRRMVVKLDLFPPSSSNSQPGADDATAAAAEIDAIERQVLESARSTVDVNRVLRALQEEPDDDITTSTGTSSHIQIAVAASLVVGIGTFLLSQQNYYLSLFVAGFVFVAAFLDADDTLAGALARILGRTTLQSLQASQPRVKALARAVVTGEEEITLLKRRMQELVLENEELRQWKEQRLQMDEALPRFKVDELRTMARENGLLVKGTKTDLLLRLMEAGVVDLD